MNITNTNRVERIQKAHPWMLNREARFIIDCLCWAISQELDYYEDEELLDLSYELLDQGVDEICSFSRSRVMGFIKAYGGLEE